MILNWIMNLVLGIKCADCNGRTMEPIDGDARPIIFICTRCHKDVSKGLKRDE